MTDPNRETQDLRDELTQLRQRVASLEAQLVQSQQFEADQRQITGSLPVLVATAGLDGRYKEVNAAFERILGWSEQESLSRPFMEFIHPDDREEATRVFGKLQSGETIIRFVDRNRCKNGSYRWISWVVIPLLEREIVFGIGQDITEQKQTAAELEEAHIHLERRVAERTEELHQSNEQLSIFKAFVEASAQGFGMTDTDGKIVYGNDALGRLVGENRPEDSYGKSPEVYYSDDYQKLQEAEIFPSYKAGEAWHGELTMVSTDGEHIPVLQTSFTLLDQEGRPSRRGVVITDLREIKQTEKALLKEQDSLRRMLRASDRDKSMFAQEIHEGVAQRLLGALMQLEAVLQMEHGLTADASDYFDAGLDALRQASVEARRLMNRTRTPVLEGFGIDAAITELIDQFNAMPDGPRFIYTCQGQLERLEPVLENTIFRVVQEAVINARLHSHGELVRVKLIQQDKDLTIDVRDDGDGFDPACVADDCFGLHRLRERTRLLGKDLKIESEPGNGTHVQATFPLIGRIE